MKTMGLSYRAIVVLLLAIPLWGCKSEDTVGPDSQQRTYENAIFGTFHRIDLSYSRTAANWTGMEVALDSTSYLHIEKSDSSYSIKLHGVVVDSQAFPFSFEEVGQIHLMHLEHVSSSDWGVGYWKGAIDFVPEPALGHHPWLIDFSVAEGAGRLSVSGLCPQIYMADTKANLRICGWW